MAKWIVTEALEEESGSRRREPWRFETAVPEALLPCPNSLVDPLVDVASPPRLLGPKPRVAGTG
jgi:hypothetical protein